MGNTISINYNSMLVTTFLRICKAEESLGVNTEGGLPGPELKMSKEGGGLD